MGTDKLVLGVRDFDEAGVPPKSRIGNKLTSFFFRILLGLSISDTQTELLPLDEVFVKVVVDTCLFLVNYRIQKTIIFKEKK